MKNSIQIEPKCSRCGIEYAFKRIGGKYKARILWNLKTSDKLRFGELFRFLPDVSTKMLTQALRELENDKLIYREVYHQVPPKVEYSLTDTGKELIPFLKHLDDWAITQMANEIS